MHRDERERQRQAAGTGSMRTQAAARRPGVPNRKPAGIEQNPVTVFLREVGLVQYAEQLISNGFDDLETLLDIEDEHMKDIGIPPGHILKLKKKLRDLGGGAATASAPQQSHSSSKIVVVSRMSRVIHPVQAKPDERQMTTVQMSWESVKRLGTDKVGEIFYVKFFKLQPESIELFPLRVRQRYRDWADETEEPEVLTTSFDSPALRKLWAKFVDAVGSAVAGLHDFNRLVPMLQQLGMRHLGYGLKPEYWRVAEKVLVEVLQEGLGDQFTKEVEMAWVMVYGFMTATMMAGFEAAKAAQAQAQHCLSSYAGSGSVTPMSTAENLSMASLQNEVQMRQSWELDDVRPDDQSLALFQAATSPLDQLPALLHNLQGLDLGK
eukprot:TRINITY_DN8351_c1_g1_i1.p1 TRINITY_DN8351_c1_g1~~TRINITY_DN8351_c1_g1_i1.p1  ORF type:complete len:399 (+),score=86.61 TRINITY_DN8351_c1_g1_i1:62-1198(+)